MGARSPAEPTIALDLIRDQVQSWQVYVDGDWQHSIRLA
jgi:hypothetical protein